MKRGEKDVKERTREPGSLFLSGWLCEGDAWVGNRVITALGGRQLLERCALQEMDGDMAQRTYPKRSHLLRQKKTGCKLGVKGKRIADYRSGLEKQVLHFHAIALALLRFLTLCP